MNKRLRPGETVTIPLDKDFVTMVLDAEKYRVIAFEGTLATVQAPASWGTAAIRLDDRVVNKATGRECSLEKANELIEDGYLTRLPYSIDIAGVADKDLRNPIVLSLHNTVIDLIPGELFDAPDPARSLHDVARDIIRGVPPPTPPWAAMEEGYNVLFLDMTDFDGFANTVIDRLTLDDERALRIARILNSDHPEVRKRPFRTKDIPDKE